ncbi:MAG: RloB family protein [Candidatus Cloacimonadota bacterium]|nr:RloB family protein [Candidatus Cloacimonadota bacterium]
MPPSRYSRKSKCRTPIRFYISPEGSKTEYNYFNSIELKKELRLENIEIIPIPRKIKDTRSAPKDVLDRLNNYLGKNKINPSKFNFCSLVIDYDNWGNKKLKQINKSIKQKNYHLYVSNPCLELWFILHKKDAICAYATPDNKRINTPDKCKKLCNSLFHGSYHKLYSLTEIAIKNAKKLDNNSEEDWPNDIGTHLYKLFEKLIANSK